MVAAELYTSQTYDQAQISTITCILAFLSQMLNLQIYTLFTIDILLRVWNIDPDSINPNLTRKEFSGKRKEFR